MDEFELIRSVLAPLVSTPGADGLKDDVAELRTSGRIAATADAIVEGVHFLPDDPIGTVAAKLVRVNASDLVAKGVAPSECLLSLIWPRTRPADEIHGFASALKDNLDLWNCRLVGGDTTSTDGPLVLSLTMLGQCGPRGPVRRTGANPGDDLWVSGTIGDGWLGLKAALGELPLASEDDRNTLIEAYRVPQTPRLDLAHLVASFASASIDVSDGLAGDAGHLATASGCGLEIELDKVPVSSPVQRILDADQGITRNDLVSGGDDYQTLFTAPHDKRAAIAASAAEIGVELTLIGSCTEGEGLCFRDGQGLVVKPASGWRHAIGS